jgi:hypothetical protein
MTITSGLNAEKPKPSRPGDDQDSTPESGEDTGEA